MQVLDSSENFGQGFSGGRRKMGFKNQKCTYTGRKMQVLDSSENFGQGFRRGRRKLGSNTQKYTCFGLYVDENWVLRSKINLVFD
jgi:hypothetical protein